MDHLNVYLVFFAVHKDREWEAYGGYVFAENDDKVREYLTEKYGEIYVRSAQKIEVKPGTILYGKSWTIL